MSEILIETLDVATGFEERRPLNKEELAQLKKDQEAIELRKAEEAAKIAQREAALAKLAAIGLDEDDLKALGL